jgi:lipopolysaccharide export system permease protein
LEIPALFLSQVSTTGIAANHTSGLHHGFGNFAENYEFAAMKANGISLQRAMRGLSIFIVSLSILAFFFANNIIPWSEYESYNLRQNIAKLKPAMAIAEGQFNEIGNINIHVAEKSGDRGQYLKNVTIHQEKSFKRGNYTVIRAKEGELISSEDSNILSLELRDGNYYDELVSKNTRKYISKKRMHKVLFDTYVINVDLANLNNVDLDEKRSDSRYNMLPISGLNFTIDSLYQRRGRL